MFDHCLYFNTTALARVAERQWSKAFRPFGLTPSQAFMLRVILARPGLLQRELAEELGISRPTATRLLDGLQQKRLIERRSGPADGRESQIHPTPASVKLTDALNETSGVVTKRIKRMIGTDVFDQTVAKLRAVRTALK